RVIYYVLRLRFFLISFFLSSHFSFYRCRDHRHLHSFPTRRSSDLETGADRGPVRQYRRGGVRLRHRAAEPRGPVQRRVRRQPGRSEEHTSELQSRENLVCRLLLEKKKKKKYIINYRRMKA